MWPMLLDLLPHFARLVPMADKSLATRSASEKAQEAALAAMAESVRGDLGQVPERHAGIQRALKEQGEQISEMAVEVTRMRLGVESTEARVAKLEKAVRLAMRLGVVAVVMLLVVVGMLVWEMSRR